MAEQGLTLAPDAGGSTTVRVVIVGGGCAGLATAWQLCKLNRERAKLKPAERKKLPLFKIEVFESTRRLGGKGASVRDANGRILEHGLHVWLGFYENAFRMMRECYAMVDKNGWGPKAGEGDRLAHGSFDEAFVPEPHIGVASRRLSGDWEVWSAFLPPMKGQPGEPLDEQSNPFTWWGYLARALALAKALMQSALAPAEPQSGRSGVGAGARSSLDEAMELDFAFDPLDSPNVLLERMARMLRVGLLTSAASVLQGVTMVERWLRERNPAPQSAAGLLKFVEALATQTRRQLRDLVQVDEELRRKTEVIDLLMTILVGLYRDRVFFSDKGLDAIDHIDYRAWLRKHGATLTAVESPLVKGIYDLVFAYRDGRHDKPSLSAAQALRGAMRMFFSYRGSMFWRMRSGMGDAVFAPLYRALLKEEVGFRFLHRLDQVSFDFQQGRVDQLQFSVLGTLTQGASPLDGFGCWPDSASAFTTATTDESKTVLKDGQHFDVVVLAAGIDGLVKACGQKDPNRRSRASGELFTKLPLWDAMRKNVATVGTHSTQVWLDADLEALGWQRGPVIVAGLGEAAESGTQRGYETWADMTHTLGSERAHRAATSGQRQADEVRSIAYFCGVLPDQAKPDKAKLLAADQAALKTLLEAGLKPLWPEADGKKGRKTPLQRLVSADGKQQVGEQGLGQQHFALNIEGSERYTQSLPGSAACRISPLDTGFANMTIAGDWTDCGFNGGCIEAAVMSGLLAAHAISGRGELHHIVGYHHP